MTWLRNTNGVSLGMAGLLAVSCAVPAFSAEPTRRNFVFFLVDDLGWADVGCNGSTFYETPHIDALAASGMRFTQGYAACPVCSPTRASILTGRHPVRVDITDWIPGQQAAKEANPRFQQVNDRDNLALEEVTIAEALKQEGYQTFFAGKWHLGDAGHLPTDQGFDINIGGFNAGSPPGGYYGPWKNPYLKQNFDGEYLTERLTSESINFLKTRQPEQPFLLYQAFYNVHTPIQPYKKRLPHFAEKAASQFGATKSPPLAEHQGKSRTRQDNAEYASMIAAVDDSVGAILQTLKELQIDDETVVVFFSDNGGLCTLKNVGPTLNLPLRSGKGWLYEGGIREPLIIRAPGVTKPGSVCEQPVLSTDFFPTILQLAGLALQPELHADGVSLLPLLRGEPTIDHPPLYWHYPHYHGSTWTPGAAIRDGDWKLIEFYEYGEVELYNLTDDVGEQHDLSQSKPQKTAELRSKLKDWQTRMHAKMPTPNPSFDGTAAGR
ncbi:MAG: sulfatase [Planctomycetaceae bacterium]|nr:sulfatase [Planctomycetaceae bacterium]